MDTKTILEADKEFREEFDRNHPRFHNGDPTLVKLGGDRIPEALKNEPDWKTLPEQPPTEQKEEDYGPEYAETMRIRTELEKIKKAIAAINPPLEAILRVRTSLASATDAQKGKLETQLKAEMEKRDKALEALKQFEATLGGTEYDKKAAIEEIVSGAVKEMNAEQQNDFMLMGRRHTQKIFNEQKALLQKLKQLKANAGK